MKIKTAKLIENGVLLNGSTSLPDGNTGHIRDSYNEWLAKGNKPEPEFTQTDLDAKKVAEERSWRDTELASADIELNMVQDGHKEGLVGDWRDYRNALRNYPAEPDFPHGDRPTPPE